MPSGAESTPRGVILEVFDRDHLVPRFDTYEDIQLIDTVRVEGA